MENVEAIKLVQSGKELSFVEIQDVLDVFKENNNPKTSSEFMKLKQQARKKISGLKEKMPEMDLQESMAAVYAMKEFSTPEERQSEDFEKVLGSIEGRIVELKKENPTNIAPNQEQYEHPVEVKEETNASEINRNYITSDSVREVCTFNADLYSDYGTENPAPSDRLASVTDLEVSQDSVRHILLFENFKFEKSYFNLTINTFPRLRLTLPAGSAANALNIDRIYLVPKGNDVEGEVDEIPVNL